MSPQHHLGYHELSGYYEHLIRTGKLAAGAELQPEVVLAEKHRVSRTTIRRAFALLVEKGLVLKRQGRGTYVAPVDSAGSPSRPCVLIAARPSMGVHPDTGLVSDRQRYEYYYFTEAVARTLGEHEYPFEIHYVDSVDDDFDRLRDAVAKTGAAGIITFDVEREAPLDRFLAIGVPVVFIESCTFGRKVDQVRADGLTATKTITRHMLRTTGGPLAFVGSRSTPEAGSCHGERLTGFREAHRELGLEVREDHLFFTSIDPRNARRVARDVLTRAPETTGFVCSDDLLAVGVLDELREQHIPVPDRVGVCGYGAMWNTPTTIPPLTTVAVDHFAIGCRAAELIEERLVRPDAPPRLIKVPTSPVFRQSTLPLIAAKAF